MTGNGNYVSLPETSLEKFVKSHQMNIFLAAFSYLEPLCVVVARSIDLAAWEQQTAAGVSE